MTSRQALSICLAQAEVSVDHRYIDLPHHIQAFPVCSFLNLLDVLLVYRDGSSRDVGHSYMVVGRGVANRPGLEVDLRPIAPTEVMDARNWTPAHIYRV